MATPLPTELTLNAQLLLTLTPRGEAHIRKHAEQIFERARAAGHVDPDFRPEVPPRPTDARGRTAMTVWEFAQIFGPLLHTGADTDTYFAPTFEVRT